MENEYQSMSISSSQITRTYNNKLKDILQAEVAFIGNIETTPDWKMKPHTHEYCEIVYIKGGSGKVYIGQDEYDATPGDLFVYNRGVVHFEHSSVDNPLYFKVIVIDNLFLDGEFNSIKVAGHSIQKVELKEKEQDFEQTFDKLLSEISENSFGSYLKIKSLLLEIITFLLREIYHIVIKMPKIRPDIKDQFVKDMVRYIQDNFHKSISLTDIANHTYRSIYYSSHVFKEAMGDSPMNSIIKLRIEKAKTLLMDFSLSVGEIASQIGYDDVHYFSNIFKKIVGISPTNYRKQLESNSLVPIDNSIL